MMQPKRSPSPPTLHNCPVCHHPQTKIARRLTEKTNGSTIYVCARSGECSVGVNLAKVETWVPV
jgi:transcription elongation factor Elf1